MAAIFPSKPIGAIAPATLRLLRRLKSLPDSYSIWQRLTPDVGAGPDLWVRRDDGRSVLLSVIGATPAALRDAIQGRLFGAPQPKPGIAEEAALERFVGDLGLGAALPTVALYPAASRADLVATLPPATDGVMRLAQDELGGEPVDWVAPLLGPRLSDDQLDALRRAITPEVIVPAPLTVRAICKTSAGLRDDMLSYDQEWAVKHDLDLSDEAAAASGDTRLQLISGVAGSGKSLVLLYRARLLRQFFPKKRMLVLTHNRPLIRDLEQRFLRLTGGDRGVEWRTFHGWCHRIWPADEPRLRLIRPDERRRLIERVWAQHLAGSSSAAETLQSEIDWVKDRLITTREAYLAADRAGRGFALNSGQRERVFDAIIAYNRLLQETGQADFGDVPRRLWRRLLEQPDALPRYDIVLIDEGQFFAPIHFEIIKQVLTPRTGHLFIVADPTQGFMRRGQSWLASGLNVRGCTQRLATSYRTTDEILRFASAFYQARLPGDEEAFIGQSAQGTPTGAPPQLLSLASEQDETSRVINEIRALIADGVPLDQVLVLHADWRGAREMLTRLRATFGAACAMRAHDGATVGQMRVCALDAATGLESPIVFVMGTHKLIEAEASVRLSAEEQAERRRDNTRRLYMAMTRAGQRLVLTYVGDPPPMLATIPGIPRVAVVR